MSDTGKAAQSTLARLVEAAGEVVETGAALRLREGLPARSSEEHAAYQDKYEHTGRAGKHTRAVGALEAALAAHRASVDALFPGLLPETIARVNAALDAERAKTEAMKRQRDEAHNERDVLFATREGDRRMLKDRDEDYEQAGAERDALKAEVQRLRADPKNEWADRARAAEVKVAALEAQLAEQEAVVEAAERQAKEQPGPGTRLTPDHLAMLAEKYPWLRATVDVENAVRAMLAARAKREGNAP